MATGENCFTPEWNEQEVTELLENATPGSIQKATKYGMKVFQGKNLKTLFRQFKHPSYSKQNNASWNNWHIQKLSVHCNIRFLLTKQSREDLSNILGAFFNKTIIPLALVGYEMIIANSALRACWLSIISYPTRARGIIVNYAVKFGLREIEMLCSYSLESFALFLL